ncbi:MAG: hypothetical protein ACOZF2_10790 [Thermodesulfobacteriota bacterium]
MKSRSNLWWLGLALAALLGVSGCSGILSESRHVDGQVERVRISGGESWRTWDRNATRGDATSFILKKEQTF